VKSMIEIYWIDVLMEKDAGETVMRKRMHNVLLYGEF